MNTQHFQYIVEIERTRSISQAAKNLCMPGVFSWRWRALKPWSYTFTEMERQLLRRILTQMKEEARLLKNPAED